MLFFSIYDVK